MARFLFFLLLFVSICAGCSRCDSLFRSVFRSNASDHTSLEPVDFGILPDVSDPVGQVFSPSISLRLDGVPLRSVVAMIGEQVDALIVTPSALDDTLITGVFLDDPLESVVRVIAIKLGIQYSFSDGVWTLGTLSDSDMVSFFATLPPTDSMLFRSSLSTMYPSSRIALVGSVVWVRDEYRTVRRIISDVDSLRERLTRAYIAEVFFVRISEQDFIEASVDLQVNSVDLFASSFKVEQLFKAITSGSGGVSSSSVESRPVVYLSESRPSKMNIGSEIVREQRRTLENGSTEVSGYQRFSDGLEMALTLNRVTDGKYSVDFNLSISTFDQKASGSSVPSKVQSSLESLGLLCSDGHVCFGGMLLQRQDSKSFKLLGIDSRRSLDVLTIWLRVREVRV